MSELKKLMNKINPVKVLVVDNSSGKYAERTILRYVVLVFLGFVVGLIVRGLFL